MMANFEGFKNFSSALAALAVPLVVAVVGSYYSKAAKEREVSGKFVELAVQILSKEPTKSEIDGRIRAWATTVLDQYSGVQFDQKTRNDIINNSTLPRVINTPVDWGSRPATGTRQINRIIVRDTQEDDLEREMAGLKAGQVSYHYLIAKNGEIRQLKDENEVAFHSGRYNEDSIGVSVLHVSGGDYTASQIESLTNLLADIVKRRPIQKPNIVSPAELDASRKGDFTAIKERVLQKVYAQR
jgi:hypothetical protein